MQRRNSPADVPIWPLAMKQHRSPAWVPEPVDMDGAARALGISRRTLIDTIKALPHYELRGRKKVFYPEHIASLRRGLGIADSESGVVSDGKRRGVPLDVMSAVLDRDNRTCVYCNIPDQEIEFDHAIPLTLGGNETAENIVVSCRKCNRQKGRKTLSQYIAWRADNGLPVYEVRLP